MWKLLVLAFVSCASAQIPTFPSFPAPTTAGPSANNPSPDLVWPQLPTLAPQPTSAPQPPAFPNWPQPQPTSAPQPPVFPNWPQPQPTSPPGIPNWPQPQPTSAPPPPVFPIWPQPQPTAAPQPPVFPNWPQQPPLPQPQPTSAPIRPTIQPPRPVPPPNNRPAWRQGTRDSRCPIPDGDFPTFFADPSNCRQYFMCSGGFSFPMPCPSSVTGSVVWNSRVNACEEVENPRC